MSSPSSGTRRFPRRFHDRMGFPGKHFRDIWKIFRTGGFADPIAAAALAPHVPRAKQVQDLTPGHGLRVLWVGHATTLVQVAGRTFLTDPVWSEKLIGNTRRYTEPGIPFEALPRIDGVLISHNHYDHLDARTIKRFPKDTAFFVPANLARWFRRRGFRHVTELDWWQSVEHLGVTVAFTPVEHWSQRLPWDRNRSLWGGWVLRAADDKSGGVFFGGDTAYTPHFRAIAERHPSLDIAILPIGAYEPRWFMQTVHMNPEEAVAAYGDLGARVMVPMHWGTFALSREGFLDPQTKVIAAWQERGLPRHRLWDLALGDARTLYPEEEIATPDAPAPAQAEAPPRKRKARRHRRTP